MVKNNKTNMKGLNKKMVKKIFIAEVQTNGKILLKCNAQKDVALVTSPQALGLFIRKNLGLNNEE